MNIKILNLLNNNIFTLSLCLIIGFTLGFVYRFETFWDLLNYHYYNAFAFLHNRLNYDIVLGGENSFFNPLPDLPLYWMIQHLNDYPGIIYGVQGLYYGVCLFFFIKICGLFWDNHTWSGIITTVIATAVAATGQAIWMQMGTATNEIQVTTFILAGLYLLFKITFRPDLQKGYKFLIVGLLMGFALGLKPTVVSYCLGAGLTSVIFYKKLNKPLPYILLFAVGGLLGYLLSNGWFMWHYWEWYQNPFFPFANSIFKSEYYDNANFRDTQFLPSLKLFFVYPYIWNLFKFKIVECSFYDIRLTVYYTIFLLTIFSFLFSKKARLFFKTNYKWGVYFTSLSVTFFIWMALFSILRYIIVVEMLGCMVICRLVVKWCFEWFNDCTGKYKIFKIAGCVIGIFLITIFVSLPANKLDDEINSSEKFLEIENFNFPDNSVIRVYNAPTSLYIAEWAKKNKIRAVGFVLSFGRDFVNEGKFKQIREAALNEYSGPDILVYRAFHLNPNYPNRNKPNVLLTEKVEREILEKNLYCRDIKSNLSAQKLAAKICVPQELKKQILGDD